MKLITILLIITILSLLFLALIKQGVLGNFMGPLMGSKNYRFGVFLALMIFLLGFMKLLISYGRK